LARKRKFISEAIRSKAAWTSGEKCECEEEQNLGSNHFTACLMYFHDFCQLDISIVVLKAKSSNVELSAVKVVSKA
jgi:hypothetical protein